MMKLGMFEFNPQLDELINGCWGDAKAELKICDSKFPCTNQHRETVLILLYLQNVS